MTLLYNLFRKRNPLRPQDPHKIYLVLRSRSKADINEVCELIAERLNIHKDLCRSVLNCWNSVALKLLSDGRIVDLGDAGSIYLTAKSEGAATEDEATARLVRNIKGHIRLSKEAREAINKSVLANAATYVAGIYTEDKEGNQTNP